MCWATSKKISSIFFTKGKKVKAIHFEVGNKAALFYFLKMMATNNRHMLKSSTKIWHYLPNHNMSIAAEYLPSVLNTVADMNIGKTADSSE